MLIKEYRITMPLSTEEYQLGFLYSLAHAYLNDTGGGEGVEIVKNEKFENTPLLNGQYSSGQYTFKKYKIDSRIPTFIRWIAPKGSLELHEEAWNAYPYCRTVVSNPGYMRENFRLTIETLHCPDRGHQENVHHLSPEQLEEREVIFIDIANDDVSSSDYQAALDPAKFHSKKLGRGELKKNWTLTCHPVMTCYKLVRVEFKWLGFQNRMERFIHRQEKRVFTDFNRKLFCWADQWYGLTMEEIREDEERCRIELEASILIGSIRGTKVDGDINHILK